MSGVCFNPYGCEWTVGYLWRSMNQFGRLDVIELGLMLAYTLVVVGLGSYRYHIACHQTRAFVRAATGAFERGAFEEAISIAAQNQRSPVATMMAAGLTAFAKAPLQFTLSEAIDAAGRAFRRSQRMFAAKLSIGLGTLKSIAYTAPFFGLVGTCFGILSAFRGIGMERAAAVAMMASDIAAALITTAAGLLVAVPAVWSYNRLRTRGDVVQNEMSTMALAAISYLTAHPQWQTQRLYSVAGSKNFTAAANAAASSEEIRHPGQQSAGSFQMAQKLPLTKLFSQLPAFPLMAAPSLIILVTFFTALSSSDPKGLDVRLLKAGGSVLKDDSSVDAISIEIIEPSTTRRPTVYVNSKKTLWDQLDNTVLSELKGRPQRTAYVKAGNNVLWADVANVIDVAESFTANVVLLTTAPKINSRHTHRPSESTK